MLEVWSVSTVTDYMYGVWSISMVTVIEELFVRDDVESPGEQVAVSTERESVKKRGVHSYTWENSSLSHLL
jgi:hypothetical protein